MRKGACVSVIVCSLLGSAGMLLVTGSLRGWLALVVCGSVGLATLLLSCKTPDGRATKLIGLYCLLIGVSAGLPRIVDPSPPWVRIVAETCFWGSFGAASGAAWFARARIRARVPTGD